MTRRATPEWDLQEQVVAELNLRTIKPARFWFCPNGGNLSITQRVRFKAMGLTPGVPDLHFAWSAPETDYSGGIPRTHLAPRYGVIELKAGKGKTSEAQNEFLQDMAIIGHRYAVCSRADDVFQTLRRWGFPLR